MRIDWSSAGLMAKLDDGWRFLRLLFRRFAAHGGTQNAASLTYTTLLSLVPLMTVTLAVISAFPLADEMNRRIQAFLFENFVPTSGELLQQYLNEFSAKAGRLSGMSSAFLLLVSLLLVRSIDRALNAVWEVRRKRRPLNKFLVYWAILTLGPLLIGAGMVLTSYLITLPLVSDAAHGGLGRRLLGLTPVLASTVAFGLLYSVVPNRRVPLRQALLGGFVAALLFELAKRGFAYYVTQFPTYEVIYGALATVPIFLVWVYLSWVIVLLGAEFTASMGIFRRFAAGAENVAPSLIDAVQLLLCLGRAQQGGTRGLSSREMALTQPMWSEHWLDSLLYDMYQAGWVERTEQGRWILVRPLSEVTLYALYRSVRFPIPQPGEPSWPLQQGLATVLETADRQVSETWNVPLQQFLDDGLPQPEHV